jgi:hypothetical protein
MVCIDFQLSAPTSSPNFAAAIQHILAPHSFRFEHKESLGLPPTGFARQVVLHQKPSTVI